MTNNSISLVGELLSSFEESHKICDETFYTATLGVTRISGIVDELVIMISDRICDVDLLEVGTILSIDGTIRTYNEQVADGKKKLKVYVFVEEIYLLDCDDVIGENNVNLVGYICKISPARTTPFNRVICDIILATNRPYGKSDYIPCIIWGRNAKYAENLSIGTKINLYGRFQSRKYLKNDIEQTAYEVSVQNFEVIE